MECGVICATGSAYSIIYNNQTLETVGAHFRNFLTLLLSGSDGLQSNTISPYGYAYPIALPFAGIGLIVMLRSLRKSGRTAIPKTLVLLWIAAAVLMALITNVNVNRINIIFNPILLLVVEGFLWLGRKVKAAGIVSAALFSVFFVLFTTAYFRDYPETIGPAFYESIGEAVQYASAKSEGKIYVTDQVNMPYIYMCSFMRESALMIF